MAVDWVQVGLVVGNFGAMGALVKVYATKVDKHAELVPVMAESLKVINETLKTTGESMRELYEGRNDHEVRLAKVETVQHFNRCDQAGGKDVKAGS